MYDHCSRNVGVGVQTNVGDQLGDRRAKISVLQEIYPKLQVLEMAKRRKLVFFGHSRHVK